jgi:G3E family GTPase
MPEPLPLVILTGFLGAGKTTCLNAVLRARDATGVVVLVNEFGAVDVDGMLLPEANRAGALVGLANGCICCTIQEDLVAALVELLRFRDAAPERARIAVLETTGLADPGAILRSVARSPALRDRVRVARVVTVCDTPRLAEQRGRFVEAERQIGVADTILMNKLDGMAAMERDALAATLRAANPLAEIRPIAPDALDPAVLLGPWADTPARRQPETPSVFARTPPPEARAAHAAVESFTVQLAAPLDADRLRDVLSFLVLRHAERLLRCKGVIRIAGEARPVLLQGVQDMVRTSRAPDSASLPEGDHGAIVFIGLGLPEATIRADLARCAAPG